MTEDRTWLQLRDAIRSTSGIVVPETSRATALKALSDLARDARGAPQAYLDSLLHDRARVQDLLDRLELGLTWFLRDEPGIRALVRKTAELVGQDRAPWIWSAGCSTGEEPYSLVMAFLEAGCPANVLATDVNSRALEVATAAVYPIRKLKQLPATWQAEFVEWRTDTHFRLALEVRERAVFMIHNFADAVPPSGHHARFDAVVCRNALIYFERDRAVQVMRQLTGAMRPGGSLLLGGVERPAVWDIKDRSVRVGSDGLITPSADHAAPPPPPRRPHRRAPSAAEAQLDAGEDDSAVPRPLPAAEPSRPHPALERASPARPAARSEPGPALPPGGREAVPAPRTPPDLHRDPLDLATVLRDARRLEHAGRAADALALVDAALREASLAAPLHLVRGLLLKQTGRLADAVEALRSARFLDRKAWLAPYQLACCLEQIGRPEDAIEAYRHALASVNSGGVSGLPEGPDIVDGLASTVAQACRSRIAELGKA